MKMLKQKLTHFTLKILELDFCLIGGGDWLMSPTTYRKFILFIREIYLHFSLKRFLFKFL